MSLTAYASETKKPIYASKKERKSLCIQSELRSEG